MPPTRPPARWTPVLAAFIGVTALAGCRLLVDPFTDELAGQRAVTTPSVEATRAAQVEPVVSQRPHTATHLDAIEGAVTHGPLYFVDPFEDSGGEDGPFAWSGADYLHWFYGPARFCVNAAFFPVSAAVTPPWSVMASDGHSSPRVAPP